MPKDVQDIVYGVMEEQLNEVNKKVEYCLIKKKISIFTRNDIYLR